MYPPIRQYRKDQSMKKVLIVLAIGMLAQGCASSRQSQPTIVQPTPRATSTEEAYALLNARHDDWKGVRYQMGGLSKRGIDCSGFVHLAFRDLFGIDIPRTTARLAKIGAEIRKSALQVGDLIFYNTKVKVHHVGIYMGKDRMLHASSSRGVMISDINLEYWASRYWKAVRVPLK
jgi:cell wall-associated NlpC family hydrolase